MSIPMNFLNFQVGRGGRPVHLGPPPASELQAQVYSKLNPIDFYGAYEFLVAVQGHIFDAIGYHNLKSIFYLYFSLTFLCNPP